MEAKAGSVGFHFAGTYIKVVSNRLIEYSLGDRKERPEFIERPEGVSVSISFDTQLSLSIEQRNRWQAILNNFARYVESQK
jgi:uncharacterized protein YndB with AHSA1/START domain